MTESKVRVFMLSQTCVRLWDVRHFWRTKSSPRAFSSALEASLVPRALRGFFFGDNIHRGNAMGGRALTKGSRRAQVAS